MGSSLYSLPMKINYTTIHTGALGDLCLAIVFARLTNWLPAGAAVDVLATQSLGSLKYASASAKVRHWDSVGASVLFSSAADPQEEALAGYIRDRHVLNFLGPDRSAAIKRFLPQTVTSIDPVAAENDSRHILEQWLDQLQDLSHLSICYSDISATTHFSRQQPSARRNIVIHMGSGGVRKCWPLEAFSTLISDLSESHRITLTLGPVELEQWDANRRRALESLAPIEAPELSQLVTLLSQADLLISNDSGPAHLAALLETPTLTLFGPTQASVWRPIGEHAYVIQGDASAGDHWGITPEAVLAAVNAIVDGL